MRWKTLVAAAALVVAATLVVGVATAGSAASKTKRQRITIVLDDSASPSTFVLTPLTAGPIRQDSGQWSACCWTNRSVTRDGQSVDIDNPKLTFKGKNGTFTWRARITFVDLDNDYTVATAVWKITRGTGAYAHLEGHGRQAFVEKTDGTDKLADQAQGVVDLGR